jgi:4-amino-4-deoxy-L-arabinose transferase-like glycosyltransferase
LPDKILRHRGKLLLLLIAALAAFLTCYQLGNIGDGNRYYTAAVKSMLSCWHNFFYASFDNGYISVDKPPLGLWLQCLFALVFGVKGWAVSLPEALCAVGSVCILHRIVKKLHGEGCGLLAALFLAVTPIFIAVSRTNNLDSSLLFVCLLSVLALISAAEKGSLKLLCLSAALLGLGFNIKMLQAFLYLPVLYLVYFLAPGTNIGPGRRVRHLMLATAVLLVVSLSWCLIVDLTPAENRPYVGSSTTNSTLELAVGYNGILRALPIESDALRKISGSINMVPNEGGDTGLLRFLNQEMFGQISWLLPLSVLGLAALIRKRLSADGADRKNVLRQLLLWGGLLIPMVILFSLSEHLHRYYLIMLAPCLAALAALAVIEMPKWTATGAATQHAAALNLLPAGLVITAAVQLVMLRVSYFHMVKPLVTILLAGEAAALLLYLLSRFSKKKTRFFTTLAAVAAVAGIAAAPLYWSYTPIQYGVIAVMPAAGPKQIMTYSDNGGYADWWGGDWFWNGGGLLPQELIGYVLAHDNGARYLISMPSATVAAPIILSTDASVMTRGGFTGFDQSISLAGFIKLVEGGRLQFFYVSSYADSEIIRYVRSHGEKVDSAEYGGGTKFSGTLYDLSGLKTE